MEWFLYIGEMALIGVAVGLISNVLGLGGGVVMVPAFLLFVDGMDMNTSKGTSLLVITFVAAVNAWRLNKAQSKPDYRLAATLAVTSMLGGFGAGYLTTLLPDDIVSLVFILFMVIIAVRTFFMQQPTVDEEAVTSRMGPALGIGLFSGAVGGATGTGGGAVLVPLALMAGLTSNSRVVALSNTVMAATAAASAAAHMLATRTTELEGITIGQVYPELVPYVFIGAMAVAPLGRMLNAKLSLRWRKLLLGGLLLFITLRLIWRMVAA